MIIALEEKEPTTQKMLLYDEIKHYCKDKNVLLKESLLLKYGFTNLETKWIKKNRMAEITMINEMVEKNLKQKIRQLTEKLKECEAIKKKDNSTMAPVFSYDKNIITIITRKKDKNGKYTVRDTHSCKKENVEALKHILYAITSTEIKETTYREVIRILIKQNDLHVGLDSFNGGRNRAKYYFPLYMRPLKVLEHEGIVKIKHRGLLEVIY